MKRLKEIAKMLWSPRNGLHGLAERIQQAQVRVDRAEMLALDAFAQMQEKRKAVDPRLGAPSMIAADATRRR